MDTDIFYFKQFGLNQSRCAMKVGTDSVLLGVFAKHHKPENILDIGTGTGLLALMMAQKYKDALITAVEIDKDAFLQAQQNFEESKFNHQIKIFNSNILLFEPNQKYDLIICNPPYFRQKQNFNIDDEKRSIARHDKDLPFENLIQFVSKHLNNDGFFWLILPIKEAKEFTLLAEPILHMHKQINIKPKPNKNYNRTIMCFGLNISEKTQDSFTIYNTEGFPTNEYINITKEFYLWKQFDDNEQLKW